MVAHPYNHDDWVSAARDVAKGWLDASEVTEFHPGQLARDCHLAMIAAVGSGQVGRYHFRPTPPVKHQGKLLYPVESGYDRAVDRTWHSIWYDMRCEQPVVAGAKVARYLSTHRSDYISEYIFSKATHQLLLRADGRPSIQIAAPRTSGNVYEILGQHAAAAVAPLLVGHRGPEAPLYTPLFAAVRAVSDRRDWNE